MIHIVGPGKTEPHRLNPAVQVLDDGRLVYREPPPDQMSLLDEGG